MKELILFWIALTSFVASGLLVAVWVYRLDSWCNEPRTIPGHHEPSTQEIQKAFKFHGISYAYQNNSGLWVFDRNRQQCKLF